MATMQQPRRPAHRPSAGKDILSRMLQMEKQSKQQRASSASPTLPLSPRADYFGGLRSQASPSPTKSPRSPRSPLATPQSPLRPFPLPRSQTSPNLTSNLQPSEKPMPQPLRVSTDVSDKEKVPKDICISPGWSDHGEKQRKKDKRRAEKEEKEREKKLKQDDERQKAAEIRAAKRLSKRPPPPAAMETQKMPSALRRDSWMSMISSQPSSDENTRRSSRDEKRLSGISFGSIRSRRSQSTPGTSTDIEPATAGTSDDWRPIVSPSAPKLPSFRWGSSRRNSIDHGKSDSVGSDDAYERDLIAFAYRLESSAIMNEPEKVDRPKLRQSPKAETPQKLPGHLTLSKSATETSFVSVSYESTEFRSPKRSPTNNRDSRESNNDTGQDELCSGHPSPALPSPRGILQSQMKSSHDGSSYVHKQRMYQQQLSIAGFEDQQAVKDANELANVLAAECESVATDKPKTKLERGRAFETTKILGTSQSPNAPKAHSKDASVSSVYTKQRNRSTSPTIELVPPKHQSTGPGPSSQSASHPSESPGEQQQTRHGASRQAGRDSISLSKPQIPGASRTDRILGFRRRTKQPLALISVPYSAENHIVAVHSAPLEGLPFEEPAVKRSRIERMFREPKPAFADESNRKRSTSSSSNRTKEAITEPKPEKSHSRTRTSSSTVLNANMTSPMLPKSTTGPALKSPKKAAKPATHDSDGQYSQNKMNTNQETRLEKFHCKNSDESKPASNPASSTKAKTATESTSNDVIETKSIKKLPYEVIVESETGEGLIRKTSIKRPRSNPQLQSQATATNPLPSLDFLPPLKHQPLVKRERQSPTRPDTTSVSISQFQEPIAPLAYESPNAPDLKLIPRSPLRPPSQFPVPSTHRVNRSSTDVGTVSFGKGTLVAGIDAKPVAKLFVICCKCKFWHDLPSRLYEAMALPLELHKAEKGKVAGGRLETAVKCPWCEHAMTTSCCQGWTTVVYLHERHH